MKGKQQSDRLTAQQKAADGAVGIFSDGYVVGYLDFDETVHILSKGDDTLDKT